MIYLRMASVPGTIIINNKVVSIKQLTLAPLNGIATRVCSLAVVVRFRGPHQSLMPAKFFDATRTKYVAFGFNESTTYVMPSVDAFSITRAEVQRLPLLR